MRQLENGPSTRAMLVGLAVCAALVWGGAPAEGCPSLQPRNPDGNYIVPGVLGDIQYRDGLALDAYVQPGAARRPLVVVVHGGGWSSGSRIAYVGQLLELLTRAGYGWVSVDYRLGGLDRYEEALADVLAAVEFVRCRAGELNADPERLILLGEDAGAHLVALAAAGRPAGVIGAVLLGGYYQLTLVPGLSERFDHDLLARASPTGRIVRGMPPVLLVHGAADAEAPFAQARSYCSGLASAGVHCEVVEVEGASHRIENWWPSQWGYKQAMVRWLAAVAPAPAATPREPTGPLRKDIIYSESRGLKLDAFIPPSTVPLPAAIIVHGGGWEAGDKVTYVTPLFEPLARAGVAWFSIDYRLTPAHTHLEQLQDLRDAIRFVRGRATGFNIDPARLFLIGESASGQMVAQIATEDRHLAGVASFYGVFDFPAMVTDASPRSLLVRLFRRTTLDEQSLTVLRRHSPLYSARREMPPLLLIAGTADRLWPQTQAFAARLAQLGVPTDVVALDAAPHGMESWEGHAEWTTYKKRMVQWMERIARPRTPAVAR